MSDIERFWAMVEKGDGCWLWKASKTTRGYGKLEYGGRTRLAHRVSWELAHGPIVGGLQVCHDCPDGDRRDCVNPAHLFLGTQKDNVDDMVRKGRWGGGGPPGERSGRAKLTDVQVAEIRSRYQLGDTSQPQLAAEFGVGESTIRAIVNDKTWRHILPEGASQPAERLRGKRDKLSPDQVRAIRQLRKDGIGPTALARRYGIGISSIYRILTGESWRDLL